MARFLIPLVIFIMMAVLFLVGLGKDPRDIPSALKDKPMPAFDLPRVKQPNLRLSDSDLSKRFHLLTSGPHGALPVNKSTTSLLSYPIRKSPFSASTTKTNR
ncbi:hypothetical protein [Candidatus Reidiella endopervernicosa]|uniref:hypothetical protein n=1 Tax=Candidatus Reidiella endopervernicosa TaxID=2738883 RepID=UPI001F2144B5|nr:hypothetical protein [Candidatus Reidiella endopervernicosa]